MSEKPIEELGSLQASVLEALWELQEGSVHEVKSKLGRATLAYTTVLTALQKLEKAGWITHRAEGRSYIYSPLKSRPHSVAASAMKLIKSAFGGDPIRLFRQLLEARSYSDAELEELRSLIVAKKKGKGQT
jgi:BlaI family penicillinase repressor